MSKIDFLQEFVLEVLKRNNLNFSEEQKIKFVPQILSLLEERIGLEMLPGLNDAQKEQFVKLSNNPHSAPKDWKNFWYSAVPSFEEELKIILLGFAEDVKRILSQ